MSTGRGPQRRSSARSRPSARSTACARAKQRLRREGGFDRDAEIDERRLVLRPPTAACGSPRSGRAGARPRVAEHATARSSVSRTSPTLPPSATSASAMIPGAPVPPFASLCSTRLHQRCNQKWRSRPDLAALLVANRQIRHAASAHDGHPDIGEGRRDRRVRLVHRHPHARDPREPSEHGVGDRAGRGLDQPIATGAERPLATSTTWS